MLVDLTEIEVLALLHYWIEKRDYIRDCRWTAKNLTHSSVQYDAYNRRYKRYDSRIRELRKIDFSREYGSEK